MNGLVDVFEASRLTGADIRQIDYFVSKGWVVPAVKASRRGVSRKYDAVGISAIRASIKKLCCCPHCGKRIRKRWGRNGGGK